MKQGEATRMQGQAPDNNQPSYNSGIVDGIQLSVAQTTAIDNGELSFQVRIIDHEHVSLVPPILVITVTFTDGMCKQMGSSVPVEIILSNEFREGHRAFVTTGRKKAALYLPRRAD